jgi:hypothetical protein
MVKIATGIINTIIAAIMYLTSETHVAVKRSRNIENFRITIKGTTEARVNAN